MSSTNVLQKLKASSLAKNLNKIQTDLVTQQNNQLTETPLKNETGTVWNTPGVDLAETEQLNNHIVPAEDDLGGFEQSGGKKTKIKKTFTDP